MYGWGGVGCCGGEGRRISRYTTPRLKHKERRWRHRDVVCTAGETKFTLCFKKISLGNRGAYKLIFCPCGKAALAKKKNPFCRMECLYGRDKRCVEGGGRKIPSRLMATTAAAEAAVVVVTLMKREEGKEEEEDIIIARNQFAKKKLAFFAVLVREGTDRITHTHTDTSVTYRILQEKFFLTVYLH